MSKDMSCKKCGATMKDGQALVNRLTGIPDFIGDDTVCTVSASSKADIVDCLKCPECGYSVAKGKNDERTRLQWTQRASYRAYC